MLHTGGILGGNLVLDFLFGSFSVTPLRFHLNSVSYYLGKKGSVYASVPNGRL